MSLGPKGERARRQMLGRLPVALWMWKTLPLAAFAGLRVVRLDEQVCAVRLPGGWRTQNPFRSTYFAAQAMAAEMKAAIERAAASDLSQAFTAHSVGRDDAADVVAAFEVIWSFKRRP